MINETVLQEAIQIGGAGCWQHVKINMVAGQKFYTTDLGVILFVGFIDNEKGVSVPIFRSRTGLSSYDYFYREIICGGSVFITENYLNNKVLKSKINRLASDYGLEDFLNAVLNEFKVELSVELNPKSELEHTKILAVNDVIRSDNGGVIISVDDI